MLQDLTIHNFILKLATSGPVLLRRIFFKIHILFSVCHNYLPFEKGFCPLPYVTFPDQNLPIVCCQHRRPHCHFHRSPKPLSTKFGTKHHQEIGTQDCSNQEPHPLKFHCFLLNQCTNINQTLHKAFFLVRGFKIAQIKSHTLFKGEIFQKFLEYLSKISCLKLFGQKILNM